MYHLYIMLYTHTNNSLYYIHKSHNTRHTNFLAVMTCIGKIPPPPPSFPLPPSFPPPPYFCRDTFQAVDRVHNFNLN